jgi:hypothetical protein
MPLFVEGMMNSKGFLAAPYARNTGVAVKDMMTMMF